MEGGEHRLAEKIQDLSDVELATLCCLVAGEHCIIRADNDRLDETHEELQEVSTIRPVLRVADQLGHGKHLWLDICYAELR